MQTELSLPEMQQAWHGNLKSYLIGLAISLLLTFTSYSLAAAQLLPRETLIYTISTLAVIQAIVQLIYFLHLGKEGKPYWETYIFFSMLIILGIIGGGSLWIMHDLNQRTMEIHTKALNHD